MFLSSFFKKCIDWAYERVCRKELLQALEDEQRKLQCETFGLQQLIRIANSNGLLYCDFWASENRQKVSMASLRSLTKSRRDIQTLLLSTYKEEVQSIENERQRMLLGLGEQLSNVAHRDGLANVVFNDAIISPFAPHIAVVFDNNSVNSILSASIAYSYIIDGIKKMVQEASDGANGSNDFDATLKNVIAQRSAAKDQLVKAGINASTGRGSKPALDQAQHSVLETAFSREDIYQKMSDIPNVIDKLKRTEF